MYQFILQRSVWRRKLRYTLVGLKQMSRDVQADSKALGVRRPWLFPCKVTGIWGRKREECHGMPADAKPAELMRGTE